MWRSPDGVTVNQEDHIAICIKHRVFLQDVRALRGADFGLTDHYLFRAKIRITMSKVANTKPPRLYDIEKLQDTHVRERFKESMEEKCRDTSMNTLESVNTQETQWSKSKN